MLIFSGLKGKLLSVLQTLAAGYIYEMDYGRIRIKRKGGLGFLKKFFRSPTAEEEFLTSLDLKGKIVYDIGGHIGVVAMVFAKAVGATGQVVVFEPNEENCSRIREHIQLNQVSHVRLLKLGIADRKKEDQVFIVRKGSTGTGSMSENIQSQIVGEKNFKQLRVSIDTLDGAITAHELPKPDFIKIDIEGMEYQALMGMAKTVGTYSPQFYIEIHGADELAKRDNICQITKLFQSWGYSLWHVETKQDIVASNCSVAQEGHIFCKRRT
jgi:FkbM family methyltransferase